MVVHQEYTVSTGSVGFYIDVCVHQVHVTSEIFSILLTVFSILGYYFVQLLECLGALHIHSPRRDAANSLWRKSNAQATLKNATSAAAEAKSSMLAGSTTCAHSYTKVCVVPSVTCCTLLEVNVLRFL